jgi:hypothetical protein
MDARLGPTPPPYAWGLSTISKSRLACGCGSNGDRPSLKVVDRSRSFAREEALRQTEPLARIIC